jgi:hypothetical protein
MATMITEDLCRSVKSENDEESDDSDKQADEEPQFLNLVRWCRVLKLSGDHFAPARMMMPV